MARDRTFRPDGVDRRTLESRVMPSALILASADGSAHKNPSIDQPTTGFLNTINTRLATSGIVTNSVNQAFQVFGQNALGIKVKLPSSPSLIIHPSTTTGSTVSTSLTPGVQVGTKPASLALPDLISTLEQQTITALARYQFANLRPRPSQLTAKKVSLPPVNTLIPYAVQQINQMNAQLTPAPGGGAEPTPQAINSYSETYSNILNAIAEFSVHPVLFRSPSDFYKSPTAIFKPSFSGIPANRGVGYALRGPGGVPLRRS